jgi:hypothetical protein
MSKSRRFNPRQAKVDQQGAEGRLTSDHSQPRILTPRTSKVPAQDSDFLTTSQGEACAWLAVIERFRSGVKYSGGRLLSSATPARRLASVETRTAARRATI